MASFLYETRLQGITVVVVVVIISDWDVRSDEYSASYHDFWQVHLTGGLAIFQNPILGIIKETPRYYLCAIVNFDKFSVISDTFPIHTNGVRKF